MNSSGARLLYGATSTGLGYARNRAAWFVQAIQGSPSLQSRNISLSRSFTSFGRDDHSRSSLPTNTVIMFVPQQEAYVVERMGKYHKILEPGLNILIPIIDKVAYLQLLKEIAIEIPHQNAITKDNVVLLLDGVLYLRIRDPYKASYGVEHAQFAITQLAQTTMRAEIGKTVLDTLNQERELLNHKIVESINMAAGEWGIECLRYEIRNIEPPESIKKSMQLQSEAERQKRAKILESEGIKQADINRAEGKKASKDIGIGSRKTGANQPCARKSGRNSCCRKSESRINSAHFRKACRG